MDGSSTGRPVNESRTGIGDTLVHPPVSKTIDHEEILTSRADSPESNAIPVADWAADSLYSDLSGEVIRNTGRSITNPATLDMVAI